MIYNELKQYQNETYREFLEPFYENKIDPPRDEDEDDEDEDDEEDERFIRRMKDILEFMQEDVSILEDVIIEDEVNY